MRAPDETAACVDGVAGALTAPRGETTWGELTADYSSMESGRPRSTMAEAFALALSDRRSVGTHCLHVTKCHGGGTRPRMPDSV